MAQTIHPALSRQSGLLREIEVLAHNVANASTTGYRAQGVVFAEHVRAGSRGGQGDAAAPSLSLGHAAGRLIDLTQGALKPTGGALDLGIEGDGFFQVRTEGGDRLTRAGALTQGPEGEILTLAGHALLDEGGAPLVLPGGAADIAVSPDGTVSADGEPVGRIALVRPVDPTRLTHAEGTLLDPGGAVVPADGARVAQGFLEASNVQPVAAMARLVEVQNAYQLGQGFMDREHERMRSLIALLDQ
jgi:flagellar basal-body rod protein FlgF